MSRLRRSPDARHDVVNATHLNPLRGRGRPRSCSRLTTLGASAFVIGAFFLLFPLHSADFSVLEPLLQEHCVECHGAKEPEGGLVLESYADFLKGGESGPIVVAGKSGESLLVKALEGNWGKTGKNQFMPPGKREKLKPEQIALFKAWIDAGAPAATSTSAPHELVVPQIAPKGSPRRPINSLAFEPRSRLLAVARPDAVELFNIDSRKIERTLTGLRGVANAVGFSEDGQFVFAGGGDATGGEVRQWKVADGSLVRTLGGHKDAVYALAITADGQTLATGGYDYAIKLWTLTDGTERTTIAANQGAIMGLGFRPDGRILASVGYDRTAKVYDSLTGTRLETFGQALKELNAIAFSPDGRMLLTGGNDNRIRAYRLGPKEGSNELIATVFAHEGAILRIAFSRDGKTVASSADDRTVKLFDAELKPRLTLEPQPDWPTALAFAGSEILAVARADGSLGLYNPADGKPAQPPKPELVRTDPRGIERGTAEQLKLVGQNLGAITVVSVYRGGRLWAAMSPELRDGEPVITLAPPADEPTGPWEVSVGNATVESARVKVWVDDLTQKALSTTVPGATDSASVSLEKPVSLWCHFDRPGVAAEFAFAAKAGQRLVFDLAAQRLGAKGDFALTLLDANGRTIAANAGSGGQLDPLLSFTVPADGTYRLRIAEATFAGSPDHFFRLSAGELPLVTGVFPLSVPANQESEVEVLGANLGSGRTVRLIAGEPGETNLPEPVKSWRTRREWKVVATDFPAPIEVEPNDTAASANRVPVPVSMNGRLELAKTGGVGNQASTQPGWASSGGDSDFFRFPAKQGVTYVVETAAAMRGSPADTRLEVFWPEGKLVERVRLKAVRNSAITFRPETSDETGIRFENWEEMELNDLLWCGGEVMKLFRAPQGPDSDTLMYSSNGKRRGFFDTTPVAHYLGEPVYLVTPLAPGEQPVPNGLPVFTLPFANEDAASRDIGADSRIYFTAPADGDFLVRVTDARDFGGHAFAYRLVIREAHPDFSVTLNGASPTVAPGSGQGFNVSVNRRDGFEGPVQVSFNHLPPGWTVPSSLVVEAGHETAFAPLNAATNAVAPPDSDWDAVTVVASSVIEGREVALAVNNLGRPKLSKETPKLLVKLEPVSPAGTATSTNGNPVVTLTPGGIALAKLRLIRNGFDGVVTFSVDNLPHGVIVENLGLNGITFLADENEREISLAAAKWVADLDRPFYAVEYQAGQQTSEPVVLRVRRPMTQANAGHP